MISNGNSIFSPFLLHLLGLSSTDSTMNDSSNTVVENNSDEREIKKIDVQNTMDFAKNIEKVKEVQ